MKIKNFNFNLGIAAGSWLLTLMIITGELYAPFKDVLKAAFGHHWIGKAVIIAVVFFAASAFLKSRVSDRHAWYSAVGSIIVIFLFFIYEFLT